VKVIKGVQAFFEQLVLKGNMCRQTPVWSKEDCHKEEIFPQILGNIPYPKAE